MKKTVFVASLRYDGSDRVWLAKLEEERRVHTHGRSVRAALDNLRDATALWFELKPASIEFTLAPQLPAGHRKALAEAKKARRLLHEAEKRSGEATVNAAQDLTRLGLTRRDVADLLGISHQRVQQLLTS